MAKQDIQIRNLASANVASPSTAVTLLNTSSDLQVFTPSAGIDLNLPTTNVKKGRTFKIRNTQYTNEITVKSSDGDTLFTLQQGFIEVVALQDTPTDATHWDIVDYMTELTIALGGNFAENAFIRKTIGDWVTINFEILTFSSGNAPGSDATAIPAGFRPAETQKNNFKHDATALGTVEVQSTGQFRVRFFNSATPSSVINQVSTVNAGTISYKAFN